MSLPYRNTIKKNKNFRLDFSKKYKHEIEFKPDGLWYQIKNCAFQWIEYSEHEGWGSYIYEIKIKNNILNKPGGILSITNTEQLNKFNNKYKEKIDKYNAIDWKKVSLDYGGFEIKNYYKIKEELLDKFGWKKITKFDWFLQFDFSSGCIWDLHLIKNYEFSKKVKN